MKYRNCSNIAIRGFFKKGKSMQKKKKWEIEDKKQGFQAKPTCDINKLFNLMLYDRHFLKINPNVNLYIMKH